jgi:hypothetical protein
MEIGNLVVLVTEFHSSERYLNQQIFAFGHGTLSSPGHNEFLTWPLGPRVYISMQYSHSVSTVLRVVKAWKAPQSHSSHNTVPAQDFRLLRIHTRRLYA